MRPLTRLPEAEARLAMALAVVPALAICRGGGAGSRVDGALAQAPSISTQAPSNGMAIDGVRMERPWTLSYMATTVTAGPLPVDEVPIPGKYPRW